MMRREAKQRSNPFYCEAECAIKQLRKAMRESGPDEITNARTKAVRACTKHVSQALVQKGVPDPDDTEAKRRAFDWVMEKTSLG